MNNNDPAIKQAIQQLLGSNPYANQLNNGLNPSQSLLDAAAAQAN